jgi:hypothetical protein
MKIYAHSQSGALKAAGASLNRVVTTHDTGARNRTVRTAFALFNVEPMTGIEPAYSAWEAFSTPEQVSDNCWSTG